MISKNQAEQRVTPEAVASTDVLDDGFGFAPTKLQRRTLNDQVYLGLKEAIITGSLYPGRVLTIRELGSSFGVSMMPVREALSRLIAEKALELKPNRSVAVPMLTSDRFSQITKIRVLLEGMAARDSVLHLGDADITELEQLNSQMESNSAFDPKKFLALNREFHFRIYAASKQDYLLMLIESIWVQVGPLLNLILKDDLHKPNAKQLRHREFISAVRERDSTSAELAIRADLQDAANFILPLLSDRTGAFLKSTG
jgi:DNA-binding GntR family transcriptional regulator